MPITHITIPVPPDQVGEAEWAEAHTLPTAAEIGALVTASVITTTQLATALEPYLTQASADTQLSVYLLSQDASTTYARQASAVTTAQLSIYLTSASANLANYLLSQDASTTYARQASAVTTAQLSIYLTSASAALSNYLLSQDASTTYARQTSAVTTAQLTIYLLAQDASTTYARQTSAVTTAQLNNISAGAVTSEVFARARLGSAGASAGVFLCGNGTWATVSVLVSVVEITEASADAKYLTPGSADDRYGRLYLMTVDITTSSNSALSTIAELIASVSASTAYRIEGSMVYRAQTTTTQNIGILCSVTPTPGTFMFGADIYGQAADGTAAVYSGYASANGDIILGTSTNMVNVDLPLNFAGAIVTGTAGQIQIAFRSEVSNTGIIMRRGSSMRVTRLGPV